MTTPDTPAAPVAGGTSLGILKQLALLHTVLMFAVFGLIGSRLFDGGSMEPHVIVGHLGGLVCVVMLLTALIGRPFAGAWRVPLVMVLLHVVQGGLPEATGKVAMLHPLNASLLLVIGFWFWLRLRDRASSAR